VSGQEGVSPVTRDRVADFEADKASKGCVV